MKGELQDTKARRRRRLAATVLAVGALWLALALLVPALSSAATDAVEEAEKEAPPVAEETVEPLVAEEAVPPASEAAAVPPLPTCEYGDEPAPLSGLDEWQHTLLDTTYRLSAEYVPPRLVNLQEALEHAVPGAATALSGQQLRDFAAAELAAMFAAAEAAGVQLAVQSAYRSYTYQQNTFDYWVQQDGLQAALKTSARAGHSEHQLGTAVDLRSRHGPAAWDLEDWAATPEGAWAQENAHRFGFVMSYPKGAEGVSCYSYEPWHFRYVGRELAHLVHGSGLAPRQVLWTTLHTPQPGAAAQNDTAEDTE